MHFYISNKIQVIALIIIALLFGPLASTSFAADYFVSQSGNDQSNGTSWKTAWRSLKLAEKKAQPGDTIHVRKGKLPYPPLALTHSGAPNNPITFRGEFSNDPPTISGGTLETNWKKSHLAGVWQTSTSSNPVWLIEDNRSILPATTNGCTDGQWFWHDNTIYYRPSKGDPKDHQVWRSSMGGGINIASNSWIRIENFNFWLGGGSGISIKGGANNSIKNITVKWHWRGVNIAGGAHHNTIENCLVTENREGIYIHSDSSYNHVRKCTASYNGNAPKWHQGDRAGIAIGEKGENIGNIIEECEIAFNGGPASDPGLIAYKAPYTKLLKNHVHDNYGHGIFVTIDSHHSQIIDNLVERNGRQAVQDGHKGIAGLSVRHGSQGTSIMNNTIIDNYVSPDSRWPGKDLGPKGGLDIRAQPDRDNMANITIKNNTVKGTVGGPDIYIAGEVKYDGLLIEPESQAPDWYKKNNK